MKTESLTEVLFEEIDKLRECKTGEEIRTESQRAEMIAKVAEKLIAYGDLQIKAFDVIGETSYKKNVKRIALSNA